MTTSLWPHRTLNEPGMFFLFGPSFIESTSDGRGLSVGKGGGGALLVKSVHDGNPGAGEERCSIHSTHVRPPPRPREQRKQWREPPGGLRAFRFLYVVLIFGL